MAMNPDQPEVVPLRTWLHDEMQRQGQEQQENKLQLQLSIVRKTTVAYAVTQLLRRAFTSAPLSAAKITIDNFVVRTKEQHVDSDSELFSEGNISGVDMLSEGLSLSIIEPSHVKNNVLDEGEDGGNRSSLAVCISPQLPETESSSPAFEQIDESSICHMLGVMLYHLYSNLDPIPNESVLATDSIQKNGAQQLCDDYGREKEPARKKATRTAYSALHDSKTPPSIIMLVQSLVESKCDRPLKPQNICSSVKEACDDLYLLLYEPTRFLFTRKQFECGGSAQLQFRQNRLYGRQKEVSLLSDAFSRVSADGNEAFFIGGFSGSGKTRLVETVIRLVEISGGYVIKLKFDHVKGRPLLELISAFNGLCSLIRKNKSPQELQIIVSQLTESVGSDLTMLGRLLPNVYSLITKGQLKQARGQGGSRMNFNSVRFILRQFMRVVSSKSYPVMIFLDDLQWSDNATLDVIHDILSDKTDTRCFFVGSYRSNEVSLEHAIFGLMKDLETSQVSTQKFVLDGMKIEDVNTLISDALCTFPRTTRCLSTIIHEKTLGNPFFCLEFLRSLVDRGLLRYSLRQGSWEWDLEQIVLENTTDNVLYLLSSKMNGLTNEVQTVLKVLSCFGIKVNFNIIAYLSSSSQFSDINVGIEDARSSGFISISGEPSCYSFAHDKVREAAYSLVPDDEKHEFHSKLGMTLISASKGDDLDDATVLTIVCQLNRNLLSLKQSSSSVCIEVSSLNYKAGVIAMNRSDFETASHYFSLASQMLPNDHWESNYELSLKLNIATAKATYSTGDTQKSQAVLNIILKEATCVEDKLDAYSLVAFIHHSQQRGKEAYTTYKDVLTQLGEEIPECVTPDESKKFIEETTILLSDLSGDSLRAMNEMDESVQIIVKFYSFMAQIAWFMKPELLPLICFRIAKITMEHGLCKHSLVGFIQFAFTLCNAQVLSLSTFSTIRLGCKTCDIAMSMLDQCCDNSEIKASVVVLISYIYQHCYPIQKVAESTAKGFGLGIASGDTVSAFFNAVQQIRLSVMGGKRLPDLLRETEKYISIAGHHHNSVSKAYLSIHRQTISTLMGINTCVGGATDQGERREGADSVYSLRRSVQINFYQSLQSFWLGQNERCHHYIEKLLGMNRAGGLHHILANFFYCLNSFSLSRKGQLINPAKLKHVSKEALIILREAEELSAWNYKNKAFLVQAEIHSHEGKVDEAEAAYGAAITAARASNFIHEQGLACEYAAFHCKRNDKLDHAVNFFHQAKLCYNEWGSSMKMDYCTRQIREIANL